MSVGRILAGVATGGISEIGFRAADKAKKENAAKAGAAAAVTAGVPANTNVRDDSEEARKKRLGRISAYATSPAGDLSPVSTATGKVLGN